MGQGGGGRQGAHEIMFQGNISGIVCVNKGQMLATARRNDKLKDHV